MKLYKNKLNLFWLAGCATITLIMLATPYIIMAFLLKNSGIDFNPFQPEAASVGIIGGADGPTTIFLTSGITANSFVLPGIMLGLIIALVIAFIKYKKDKDCIVEYGRSRILTPTVSCFAVGVLSLALYETYIAVLFVIYGMLYFTGTLMKRFKAF